MKVLIGFTKNNKHFVSNILKNIISKNDNLILTDINNNKETIDKDYLKFSDIVELNDDIDYIFVDKDRFGFEQLIYEEPLSINKDSITFRYTTNGHIKTINIPYKDIIAVSYDGKKAFDKLAYQPKGSTGKYIILNKKKFKELSKERGKILKQNLILPRFLLKKDKESKGTFKVKKKELNKINKDTYPTIMNAKYLFVKNKESGMSKFIYKGKGMSGDSFYSKKLDVRIVIF